MICGAAAHRRLWDIVDYALERSPHAGRIDPQAVFEKLQYIIVQRFLREKRELNRQEADRAVSAAIKVAAKARMNLTHLFPCHLGHSNTPESFSIGPVKFQQRSRAFERLEPALQAYLDRPSGESCRTGRSQDDRRISEMLLSDVREYYESFGWIAEVTITDHDRRTSRQRASRMVQSALDCLQLLLGAAYSNHMRMGGPNFHTDKRGQIELNADGVAEISASIDWLAHPLGDGWWTMVNKEGGERLIALMGVAIEAAHDVPRPAPLAQRFVDAAAWYGEAVRDEFAASRLVKYVTAIERILTTKRERSLSDSSQPWRGPDFQSRRREPRRSPPTLPGGL